MRVAASLFFLPASRRCWQAWLVTLRAPGSVEELDVIAVRYRRVEVTPFVPTDARFAQDKQA